MQKKTVKLTTLAVLSALAFLSYLVMPKIPLIPALPFLHYDPKDVIIVIGGFVFGPLSALAISVVVSFVELVTVSTTGYIGFIMNVLSTCAFACTASAIYKGRRSAAAIAVSLAAGVLCMTAVMLLWSYLITPLYLSVGRDQIVLLLIPGFLPFNLIKGGLNAGLAVLVYTPLRAALGKTNLLPSPEKKETKANVGALLAALLAALFVIATCVLLVFVLQGRI